MAEIVRACTHVSLSETGANGKRHFDCGHFHSFQEYACVFAPGRMVLQSAVDQQSTTFGGLMLSVSQMDDKQLEGYEHNSDIPAVLFQFHNSVSLGLFVKRAVASTCATVRVLPAEIEAATVTAVPYPPHIAAASVVPSPKATHVTDAKVAHQESAQETIAEAGL
jgi:hypothetical protein